MDVIAVSRFLAVLAIVAAAVAVVVGAAAVVPGPLRDRVADVAGGRERLLGAAAVAVVATLGSLYYSEVAGYTPCRLCWYQRIAMYPLAVILPIAVWRVDLAVRRYVVPIAVIGAVIATYHVLIQWVPALESGACDVSAPCAAFYVKAFGFVSIPAMALAGFLAVIALTSTAEERP